MRELYRYLAAKNDVSESKWLPLWVHCLDTYHTMRYLLQEWKNSGAMYAITKRITEDKMQDIALLLALLHDFGKASVVFQSRISEGSTELRSQLDEAGLFVPETWDQELRLNKEVPHGAAGEMLLLINGCPPSIAAVVGAHRGRPWDKGTEIRLEIEELLEDGEQSVYKELAYGLCLWGGKARRSAWLDAQKSFLDWALSILSLDSLEALPEIGDSEAIVLAGFVIMADWLASNERYFPLIPYDQMEPDNLTNREAKVAERIKLPPSWRPIPNVNYRSLSQKRFGFLPNEVQEAAIKAVLESAEPGLMILEAPMGVGKTEAALLAAEEFSEDRAGGLLFALPTQATANGIFPRVIEWGEKQSEQNVLSIRLAHGMAAMNEEYASILEQGKYAECIVDDYENNRLVAHDFFQGTKQALLADFVVSTIDQVLLASLKQKHFMLRHLGLSGKVVIIDECHAYDAYMNEYLERTLEWLGAYRTPVIMLSATLPYERRAAFVDAYQGKRKRDIEAGWRRSLGYPLLTWTDGDRVCQKEIPYSGVKRSVGVNKVSIDDPADEKEEVLRIIKEGLCEGGCAAVILNTVKRAQEMAETVRNAFPDKKVLLLHSRFIAEDRLTVEDKLLKHMGKRSMKEDRDDYIVIGTQVIEQSLDFDVDLMITDLCPMDLLLQRIGRLHRHFAHDADRPDMLKEAKCYVLGCGSGLNKGSEAVYGSYLLMRTSAMLPDQLKLPDDISCLVQNVYDDTVSLASEPEGYDLAARKFREEREKDRKNADAFRIMSPGSEKTINHFLAAAALADEEEAKAQVRNGDRAVEVIALFREGESVSRTPWRYHDIFDIRVCPGEAMCRAISNQRMGLPSWVNGLLSQDELGMPESWMDSVWLKGKKLLIFDENGNVMLEKIQAHYDREYGLRVERRKSD